MDEHDIIGLIYDAALNPQLWPKTLACIVEFTESCTAIFTALDQLNPAYNFLYTHNIHEKSLVAYQDERVKVIDMNIHAPLWEKTGVGGTIIKNCLPYADMPNSDEFIFYKKCLEPSGVAYITAVLLDQGQYSWGVLGLHRSPLKHEYTSHEAKILQRLGKHFRRALQIHRQLSAVKQENRELYHLLDCLKTGVIIIDEDHVIRHSNIKARLILGHSGLLWPDQYNRLKVPHAFQDKLSALIQSALFQQNLIGQVEAGGVLGVFDVAQEQSLMLTVVPLSRMNSGVYLSQPKQAAVFITDSCGHHQLASEFLLDLYALTKRELQMCELFLNGLNLEQIAEHCGISLQSARTYLKHIFSKTQCTSQVELIRLLTACTINFEHII